MIIEMFNWTPIIGFAGFIAGIGLGQIYIKNEIKKTTPLIKFISDEDKLAEILKIGITIDENTMCHVCKDRITLDNVGLIIQRPSEEHIFICSKKICSVTNNMSLLQKNAA